MKKLFVFTENYARGGGNRYMIDLINSVSCYYDEVVVRSNAGGVFPEDLQRLDSPINYHHIFFFKRLFINNTVCNFPKVVRRCVFLFSLALEPFILLFNIALFVFIIRRIKPSKIISCNGGYPAARACLAMVVASKVLSIPAILSVVSMPSQRNSYMRLYEKIIDKLVWKSVDVVIVNAKSIAFALCDLRGASAQKIEVIFNGIKDRDSSFLKKDKKNEFVIGCIARMDAAKGVLLLLEAFACLAKRYKSIRLILVGQGDASSELKKRAEELKLTDQIELLGYYDGDIFNLIDMFDIYVLPSLWEGLPYSIIEAMCSACAIIATKVGGVPEIIKDDIEGILIKPNSITEIIGSVERLIADPKLREKIAVNARKRFEKNLTCDYMAKRFRNLFLMHKW